MTHDVTGRVLPRYSNRPSTDITPEAPDWFHRAMAVVGTVGEVEVAGTPIRYLAWGPTRGPAIVLVHGGAAHAQWWAPLGPDLEPARRVVAMDLSGHGLSGWRDVYSVDTWADEILAVAQAVSEGPATIIGHSLGGIVLAYASVRHGRHFARAIGVDAPVWADAPAPEGALASRSRQPLRSYASADEARDRFRLIPRQECVNSWYVDHVAWHGMHRTDEGWQWRFDPRVFADPTGDHRIARFEGSLTRRRCPYTVVMGERSYLTADARAAFEGPTEVPLHIVADAAHHVMLDQPQALLTTLQTALADRPT